MTAYEKGVKLLKLDRNRTKKWLNKDCPTISDWIEIAEEVHNMEMLTFSLRYKTRKGEQYWKKWRDYIDER